LIPSFDSNMVQKKKKKSNI